MLFHLPCNTPLRVSGILDPDDPNSPVEFTCDVCNDVINDPNATYVVDSLTLLQGALKSNDITER